MPRSRQVSCACCVFARHPGPLKYLMADPEAVIRQPLELHLQSAALKGTPAHRQSLHAILGQVSEPRFVSSEGLHAYCFQTCLPLFVVQNGLRGVAHAISDSCWCPSSVQLSYQKHFLTAAHGAYLPATSQFGLLVTFTHRHCHMNVTDLCLNLQQGLPGTPSRLCM